MSTRRYLYVDFAAAAVGVLTDDRLAAATDRHVMALGTPPMRHAASIPRALQEEKELDGVVLALTNGFVDRSITSKIR